jgi:transcriptional repressor NrdR
MTKPKLACPFCGGLTSKVVASRPRPNRGAYRRRRQCTEPDCRRKFWTIEAVERKIPRHI